MHLSYDPGTPVNRSYVSRVRPYSVVSILNGRHSARKSAIRGVTAVPFVKSVTRNPLRLAYS